MSELGGDRMRLVEIAKKYWWIAALIAIFIFSFWIRELNTVPDRILSYDPTFQYRFTKYVADYGTVPAWDELSYYTGRAIVSYNYPPLMWYITAFVYKFFAAGATLKTIAAFMGAVFGAMITIPAFLLGRELSNKYGGLMAALLVGTAPQILVRTFGSSFDNDQIVLFFILLTTYLGIYAMRKRTVGSVALATLGFTMFAMTWGMFWYPFFVLLGSLTIYSVLNLIRPALKHESLNWWLPITVVVFLLGIFALLLPFPIINVIASFAILALDAYICLTYAKGKANETFSLIAVFVGILITASILSAEPVKMLGELFGFAGSSEKWIVTISIAELQSSGFVLANMGSWILAMGRFAIGDPLIDMLVFLSFAGLIIFGLAATYMKNIFRKSALLALMVIALYTTTSGIRFTEFSSGFMIIVIAAGFGYLVEWLGSKERFLKTIVGGIGLMLAFLFAVPIGYLMGQNLGPDMDGNWDSAWNFLRTQTPQDSLVGTWWDPGHMITGLAERRVVADGAHCGFDCKYTINDRIVDLGKTFATNSENESVQIIRKYQGDSPKVYWIASDDLIGKFQWLQYFGTGCDARDSRSNCPLYYQLQQQSASYTMDGEIGVRYYGDVMVLPGKVPLPLLKQGNSAALFSEILYYEDGKVKQFIAGQNVSELAQQLKPIADQLGVKLSDKTVQATIWVRSDYAYVVIIPENQRNNVFTKMFFLEGEGLENFKMVFSNQAVKIYEVTALENKG